MSTRPATLTSPPWAPPLVIGIWSAAVAVAPGPWWKLALIAPAIAGLAGWLALLRPHRWLTLFFICLLLTPPLPLPLGDSGVHTAPLLAGLGILAGLVYMRNWRGHVTPLLTAFVAFVCVLLISLSFAALYSGVELAARSLLRVGLFAISVYVFTWAADGPNEPQSNSLPFIRILFTLAILAAVFACADFYFQFPAPAGFENQFVWLDEGLFRRAQGLFYEASTLGNFCAFFIVMTVVAFFRPRGESPLPRPVLAVGGFVFSAALILSYSRASIITVLVGCAALLLLRRVRIWHVLAGTSIVVASAAAGIRFMLPSFAASYWTRIAASFEYFLTSPNGVLSGRLVSWNVLTNFLASQPLYAIFGIGYKTLPYTNFVGTQVVADNTYLSLVVETGVIGLGVFLFLNFLILRNGLRAARSRNSRASFLGEWFFCFWVGEMVQMLSGDLITYWRVLPVYFWVLGTAIREARNNP
jgi:O-antigen ligase